MQCKFHDLVVNAQVIQETLFFNVYVYEDKFLGKSLMFLPFFIFYQRLEQNKDISL